MSDQHRNFGTRALWAAYQHDSPTGDVVIPIHHSVNFAHDDIDEWLDIAQGKQPGYIWRIRPAL